MIQENTRTSSNIGKRTKYRFVALAMILALLTLSTADRAAISIAAGGMQKALSLNKTSMGVLMSAFSWAYVIGQLPSGWLGDKIGSKKIMAIGVAFWSLATFAMGFSGWFFFSFGLLIFLRICLGAFETPVGPGSGRILAAWFPTSERGVAGSIYNSAQYVSIAIFSPFMGLLAFKYGWEYVYLIMGALGFVFLAAWLKLFHVPRKHPKVNQAELDYITEGGGVIDLDSNLGNADSKAAAKSSFSWSDVGKLFKSRMLVGIFIAQYCVNAITYFFMTWFPNYLVTARHFSILNAGIVASLPAVFGCIGGLSSGFVSDGILKKSGSLSLARKIPITIGLLLSASIILCNYTDSNTVVIAFMCLAFFGKGFGSLGWTVISDTAPKKIVGVASGVFNGLGNLAGIIVPVIIGMIVDKTGSFSGALLFVGIHGVIAVLSYWIIVGRIQRLELE
ncbi:major facilitator superfamily MFS_1 [Clostridium sp. DL-VIII]|uniref:MFS transporter n=1 Tax=Clostridium sp. DL-VIII TaxID=641107 RepID=UPI00023AF112|nr:MFS transporter [Clostridium sp. DL-VIII]EHI97570.1 major facilitator superfamily MFS_1 [Clostridium sp. DL-VIII]